MPTPGITFSVRLAQRWRLSFTLLRWQSNSSAAVAASKPFEPPQSTAKITIDGKTYPTDNWTNVPNTILQVLPRKLYQQPSHPIGILRDIIESKFPTDTFTRYENFPAVVSVEENFDSLGFPPDHPGRSRTDTYYINSSTLLRTHTSAHEAETFQNCQTPGYLISADVYRRDAIDKSHYPAFHQMEAARMWKRTPNKSVVEEVEASLATLPNANIHVSDEAPPFHPQRNPTQPQHTDQEATAVGNHLKRTLEGVMAEVFTRAATASSSSSNSTPEPLQVRWIEAYFPFTSPSWEMEVFWNGQWLELLGCGVTRQGLLDNNGARNRIAWAFGIGLERLAMVLFGIPDIRLFWSLDPRFTKQFTQGKVTTFRPYSKYPACVKDIAFWIVGQGDTSSAGGGSSPFHENDFMEVVRDVAGDLVEDCSKIDEYHDQATDRRSLCYRILYRSMDRSLSNNEINALQNKVRETLVQRLGIDLR